MPASLNISRARASDKIRWILNRVVQVKLGKTMEFLAFGCLFEVEREGRLRVHRLKRVGAFEVQRHVGVNPVPLADRGMHIDPLRDAASPRPGDNCAAPPSRPAGISIRIRGTTPLVKMSSAGPAWVSCVVSLAVALKAVASRTTAHDKNWINFIALLIDGS